MLLNIKWVVSYNEMCIKALIKAYDYIIITTKYYNKYTINRVWAETIELCYCRKHSTNLLSCWLICCKNLHEVFEQFNHCTRVPHTWGCPIKSCHVIVPTFWVNNSRLIIYVSNLYINLCVIFFNTSTRKYLFYE